MFPKQRLVTIITLAMNLVVVLLLLGRVNAQDNAGASPTAPLGTGFTYQGQLKDNDAPVNDVCDLSFRLLDAAAGGNQVGNSQTINNVTVSDGLFTVTLNSAGEFGSSAFTGEARWLEVSVRCPAGSGSFVTLDPLQELTAAPYALHSVSTGALQSHAVSAVAPATGDVLQWDGSQWSPTALTIARRQFYMTTNSVPGNQPLTACASGYHMASLWEIHDVSILEYNTTLGLTLGDSGNGPPLSFAAWIRTGSNSNTGTQVGVANCAVWSSNDGGNNGTIVALNPGWDNTALNTSPWDGLISACSTPQRVWCVED